MKKLLLIGALIVAAGTIYAFDLHKWLDLASIRDNREALGAAVATNPVSTALLFIAVYAVVVALSIPGAVFLTLAGGFLFGTWLGGLLVVVGATIGATILFIAAKTVFGDQLLKKVGPWAERFENEFRDNGQSYLLVMRLVPVFPFWLVNLLPAFLGVGLTTFVLTTFFGIMPGSLVYASVGNGLDEIFKTGGTPDLSIITQPSIFGPLLGLAALACVPVVYKKWTGGNASSTSGPSPDTSRDVG